MKRLQNLLSSRFRKRAIESKYICLIMRLRKRCLMLSLVSNACIATKSNKGGDLSRADRISDFFGGTEHSCWKKWSIKVEHFSGESIMYKRLRGNYRLITVNYSAHTFFSAIAPDQNATSDRLPYYGSTVWGRYRYNLFIFPGVFHSWSKLSLENITGPKKHMLLATGPWFSRMGSNTSIWTFRAVCNSLKMVIAHLFL